VQTPVRVTFRNLSVSEAVERACREEAEKLERYHPRITGCHVAVSQPHKRHRKGNPYRFAIEITIPGGDLVASRDPSQRAGHVAWRVALRDAFDTARRLLEDRSRRMRGDVKTRTVREFEPAEREREEAADAER
jgi:ribosome-associated translation inhibitor RaiA